MKVSERQGHSATGGWLRHLLRVVGIVVPFAWISYQIEVESLRSALSLVPLWILLPTLVLPLLPMALQGIRWWVLLRSSIPSLSMVKTLECHFVASYYGLVLPGASAQEVVRAFMLSRHVDYAAVWGSTWISKILGLVSWIIIGLFGLVMSEQSIELKIEDLSSIFLSGAFLIFLLLFASFSKTLTRPIRVVTERFIPQSLIEKVTAVRDAIYAYRGRVMALTVAMVLTVLLQLILVLGTSVVLYGICGAFDFWPYALVLALIEIAVVVLPITPGGIGIREGLMAWLFEITGVGMEQVGIYIALSFLGNATRLIGGIPIALGRVSYTAEQGA